MRRLMFVLLVSLALFLLHASLLYAAEPIIFKGIRSLGMGNAFVAVANGHDAVQHNVAGLRQVRGSDMIFLNTMMVASKDFLDAYTNINDLKEVEELNDLDPEALDNLYHYDLYSKAEIQLFNYVDHIGDVNHFGLGVYGILDTKIDIDRDVMGFPIAEYYIDAATVVKVGYSRDFNFYMPYWNYETDLSLGLALKYYNVGRLDDKRHVLELVGYSPQDIPKWDGSGIGADVSLFYPFMLYGQNMTFGMSIQDVGGTKIEYKDNPNQIILTNVRWGISYRPNVEDVPVMKDLIVAFEWEDFFNKQETSFGEKIHLGVETYLSSFFALRFGFNQGYPTFGTGFDWKWGSLEYAFYGEEMGTYVGQNDMYSHALQLKLLNF